MEKEKDVWSFKTSDLVTIPNIITYVRFVLIIPFVYFFLAEQYIYAAICIGLSGLSDCFDGMAARKLNQVTPLGKIIDPIGTERSEQLFSTFPYVLSYFSRPFLPTKIWCLI